MCKGHHDRKRSSQSSHGRTKFSADNEELPFNPFPNKPWVLCVCSTSFMKILWEKEKLLIDSNFSFPKCFLPVWKTFFHSMPKIGVSGKELTHSHTMTPFDALGIKPFENTVGKGEIARNKLFLLFPQCFLPVWIPFCHFHQI